MCVLGSDSFDGRIKAMSKKRPFDAFAHSPATLNLGGREVLRLRQIPWGLGRSRDPSWRLAGAGGFGVVAGAVSSDAAHPRDVLLGPPGGELCGQKSSPDARRSHFYRPGGTRT